MNDDMSIRRATPGAGDNPGPEEVRTRLTELVGTAKWGATSDTYRLLNQLLGIAVPAWIMRILSRGGPEAADYRRVAGYIDELGRADVLLFGGKHQPGEIAAFFNHMAEAMAVLSFCPRGIELFDLRYESQPLLGALQETRGGGTARAPDAHAQAPGDTQPGQGSPGEEERSL